jgi:hypothetical protein
MVRYRVLQAESTEPAIGQIEMDLFAQSALGTNAKAVTDDSIRTINSGSIDGRPVWL